MRSEPSPAAKSFVPHRISALILDLDDTLIDTRAAMVEAGTLVAQDLWPDADPRRWRGFGERYCFDPQQFYERYARGEIEFMEMRRLRFEETRGHHELADVGDRFSTFETDYWSAFEKSQALFDDTLQLLDAADDAGLPMSLVTNSSQLLADMKVRVSGLGSRFVSVLTTGTYGIGKPDRRLFDHAMRDLDVPAAQILSVGDHLGRDITPAVQLGMQAAWLVRVDSHQSVPDDLDERVHVVATLAEVVELLR
ncbi:MAG: HAD family hydrolase [Nakamurella sp.]